MIYVNPFSQRMIIVPLVPLNEFIEAMGGSFDLEYEGNRRVVKLLPNRDGQLAIKWIHKQECINRCVWECDIDKYIPGNSGYISPENKQQEILKLISGKISPAAFNKYFNISSNYTPRDTNAEY